MARIVWEDRIVERPRTFSKIDNPDGTITLIPSPGQVIHEGTPVNAENLNALGNEYDSFTSYINNQYDDFICLVKDYFDDFKLSVLDPNFYIETAFEYNVSFIIDSNEKYIYVFRNYLSNKYSIRKYDINTFEILASSTAYIANSDGVVQNDTHLFVPVGTGSTSNRNQLAKINKETMLTDKIVPIGNSYSSSSVHIYNDLIYIGYYGNNIKVLSTEDLSTVKSGRPFSGSDTSHTFIAMSPGGRIFGYMGIYDSNYLREIDAETLTVIASIAVPQKLRWVQCNDDNNVFIGTDTEKRLRRLDIGNGNFKFRDTVLLHMVYENIGSSAPMFVDEDCIYTVVSTADKMLVKINKDTMVPERTIGNFYGTHIEKTSDGRMYIANGSTINRTRYK